MSEESFQYGLETEVARHLSNNYGDRAWTVLSLAQPTGETWPLYGIRLSPKYPCKRPFFHLRFRSALTTDQSYRGGSPVCRSSRVRVDGDRRDLASSTTLLP
jgi:hypothetical protein